MEKTGEQQIYEDIFAPAAMEFAAWILDQSVKDGTERLYFLARDGYQIWLAAKTTAEKKRIPVECRYLEGSRFAWRLPQYGLLGDRAIDMICTGGIDVTLRKILRRGGLDEAETVKTAEELGLENDLDRKLTYSETTGLSAALKKSATLRRCIKSRSEEARENALGYFRQEGLFDNVRYAVADSGWTGSIQQTLGELLDIEKPGISKELRGYYFGLYQLPEGADKERYSAFYFEPYKDIGRKARFSNCLFEAVFSEPRGMTLGYEKRDGRFVPVRETEYNPNRERIEKNIDTLKNMLACEDFTEKHSVKKTGEAMKRMERLMSRPGKEEAEIMGSYLFSDDVHGTHLQKAARDLTEDEIKAHHPLRRLLLMKGIVKGELADSAWIEGSVAKYGKHTAWHLLNARIYKYIIYIRKRIRG